MTQSRACGSRPSSSAVWPGGLSPGWSPGLRCSHQWGGRAGWRWGQSQPRPASISLQPVTLGRSQTAPLEDISLAADWPEASVNTQQPVPELQRLWVGSEAGLHVQGPPKPQSWQLGTLPGASRVPSSGRPAPRGPGPGGGRTDLRGCPPSIPHSSLRLRRPPRTDVSSSSSFFLKNRF